MAKKIIRVLVKRDIKREIIALAGFLALLFMPVLVNAYGVSSPFWDTRPLVLHPGETQDVSLEFQNMVGEKDILFKATVVEGADIVTIIDANKTYFIPFGSKHVQAKIRVSIPPDAKVGTTKKIAVLFSQVSESTESGKMVQLVGGVTTTFPVLVKAQEPKVTEQPAQDKTFSGSLFFAYIGVIIVLGIILYFIVRRRRNSLEEI